MLSKKHFFRFLTSLFLLFCLLFVFDRIGGAILKKLYFSQNVGSAYRTTYAIDSTKADILVFGSSRANHHYVPKIFEEKMSMNFYNTGRDGNFFIYNYSVFLLIIERYSPRIVIFDVNPGEFEFEKDSRERLSSLLPYYDDHPEIKNTLKNRSTFERIKLLSKIYPFNSSILSLLVGIVGINGTSKLDTQGYLPLYGNLKDTIVVQDERKKNEFDKEKKNALLDILEICKSKDIQLLFISSPIYKGYDFSLNDSVEFPIDRKDIKYLDFIDDDSISNNNNNFKDIVHLNDQGANLFSKKVADKLISERHNLGIRNE